jgi:hypothetical protein
MIKEPIDIKEVRIGFINRVQMGARDFFSESTCQGEDRKTAEKGGKKEVSEPSSQSHEIAPHGWKERDDAHSN